MVPSVKVVALSVRVCACALHLVSLHFGMIFRPCPLSLHNGYKTGIFYFILVQIKVRAEMPFPASWDSGVGCWLLVVGRRQPCTS